MKSLLFLAITLFTIISLGCNKKTVPAHPTTTYKGVVVIGACGNYAIETIGPDYLGEASWSASSGSTVYHHVFAVQNGCQFGIHQVGDTISFKVVSAQTQTCAQCMLYVPLPATKYPVQVLN